MTETEYLAAAGQTMYLAACALQGRVPEKEEISRMNLDRVYEVASAHMLAAAAGTALEAAGVADPAFRQAVARAQRRTILLDRDRAKVLSALEDAGIRYMPLKGSVLKERYPRFGMREMADNDILIDPKRAKDVRKIMTGLGFSTESFGADVHDTYHRQPVSNFEMHRGLFSNASDPVIAKYYANVPDRLIKDEGNGFGYHFSEEDLYLYVIAHEYKHFDGNGTGLRSLADVFILLQNRNLDWEYIRGEAEKMGIAEFERENRELTLALFSGEPLTGSLRDMFEQIALSGAYGSLIQGINRAIGKQGRFRYFLSRLIPSYAYMVTVFPVLDKVPFLYPVLCIARLVRALFTHRRKKAALEMKAVLNRGAEEKPGAGRDEG